MKWLGDLLYRQATWIYNKFDIRRLMILSMLMVWIGVLFIPYLPFSGEAVGIFLMSAGALIFAGVGTIASMFAIIKDTEEIQRELEDN